MVIFILICHILAAFVIIIAIRNKSESAIGGAVVLSLFAIFAGSALPTHSTIDDEVETVEFTVKNTRYAVPFAVNSNKISITPYQDGKKYYLVKYTSFYGFDVNSDNHYIYN